MSFTPGPWETSRRYSHAVRWLIHPAGRPQWSVASVPHGGPTQHDRHDADAHLIAAAPDLYDALQAFGDDPPPAPFKDERYERAYAALAKARGDK